MTDSPEAQLINDLTRKLTRRYAERMEKELLGAWRAGYSHLHVYRDVAPMARASMTEQFTDRTYVFPTKGDWRPDPDGLAYQHTYDLESAPDELVRKAARGELKRSDLPDA